ncbi:MAG: hypothetical protein NTX49_06860 [Chlamydiae bacterium]|nr:hypothetical protein [Chlamydiota bacterium]
MSISAKAAVSHDVVVYYHSVGGAGGQPPVVANLLKPDVGDGFIPTMPGKSITRLWSSVYSGSLDVPVSESLELHHNHPAEEECLAVVTAALQTGEVWRVSALLSTLAGCRDAMSLFHDSARLTYSLKLVTPSLSGGMPQITDSGIVDLNGALESQISGDREIIVRIESLFSRWVLGLDPRTPVITEPPSRFSAAAPVFVAPPPSRFSADAGAFVMRSARPPVDVALEGVRGPALGKADSFLLQQLHRSFGLSGSCVGRVGPEPERLPLEVAESPGLGSDEERALVGFSLLEQLRSSFRLSGSGVEGVASEAIEAAPAELEIEAGGEVVTDGLLKVQSCGDLRSVSDLPGIEHPGHQLRRSSL